MSDSDSDVSEEDVESFQPEKNDSPAEEADETARLKKELSTMSFEELQKLQNKLGIKVYNQAIHGTSSKADRRKRFKRENKNRPMERSSKLPVSRFREVVPVKKQMIRDPRFDDLSGEYKEDLFSKSYSFLDDLRSSEKEKLEKKLKKEKNEEKKEQLQYLLKRMNQQEKNKQEKAKNRLKEKEWKKKEQELVKQGKTPYFLKKSEKKKLDLADRYKDLKKHGKLDAYLNKKRKKTASKDRKLLPQKHDKKER